jgi:hypothetical protein
MLDREEYIEQTHFFHAMAGRAEQGVPTQDLLAAIKEEALATTNLPIAIDFLSSELKLHGVFHTAMAKLAHYFTAFQTFLIGEAENDRGRFDINLAFDILEREAQYRAQAATPQGLFMYEFESLCRSRLNYDKGLDAISKDSVFDAAFKEWIQLVRLQVGLIDVADLIFLRSDYYADQQRRQGKGDEPRPQSLFGMREGRIAQANRKKDPLYLFSAMQRQLGYPTPPRQKKLDETNQIVPQLLRRMERLESRLKLVEEESKGGIDITKFYVDPKFNPHQDEK